MKRRNFLQSAALAGTIPPAFIGYLVAGFAGACVAAVGATAGAVVVLARRQLVDMPSILLALTTVGLLYRFKKLPELSVIGGAAVIGLLLR